eukprot:36266_1
MTQLLALLYITLIAICQTSSKAFRSNNEPGAKNTTILNFASYIITQNVLTDAPARYSQFIFEAIDWLNQQKWPDESIPKDHGCSKYIIYLSQGTVTFKMINTAKAPDGISLAIVQNGFSFETAMSIVINAPCSAQYGIYCAWPIYGCLFKTTVCNHKQSTTKMIATASDIVNLNWDATTKKLSVKVNEPSVVISNVHFSADCSELSDLEDILPSIEGKITQGIQQGITQAINEFAAKIQNIFNFPNTFQAYPGVNVTYFMTNLIFSPNQWAKATANGYLQAKDPKTGKWLTYVDYDIADASMQPPLDWPWSHIINQQVTVDGKIYNERLWLLNGLRVTSTLLTALVWAADTLGDLTPSYNFTALDATIIFNLTWSKPLLGVPVNGTMSIKMGYGIVNGTCYPTQTGPPEHNETVIISFYFTDLMGAGTVQLVYNQHNTSLAIQITELNTTKLHPILIKPKLPLPTHVIENMMVILVNKSIPLINAYLAEHAMVIPSGFSQWIPYPELTLKHQSGCCNGQHGYMQFYSLCSCDTNNPQHWDPCANLPCKTDATFLQTSRQLLSTKIKPKTIINLYQIWIHVYNTESCAIGNNGNMAVLYLANNTNGACKILSPYLPAATQYYVLTMSSENSIQRLQLLCNSLCSVCKWPADPKQEIKFSQCYTFTYQSSILILKQSLTPCIGGNVLKSHTEKNKNTIIVKYNATKSCQSGLISVQNLGNLLNGCVESDISAGSFNYLQSIKNTKPEQYNLGMNCTSTCAKCTEIHQNIQYNLCVPGKVTVNTMKFLFVKDTDQCGNVSIDEKDLILPILLSILGFALLITIIIIGFKNKVYLHTKLTNVFECCTNQWQRIQIPQIDCSPVTNALKWLFITQPLNGIRWIYNSFSMPWTIHGKMTSRMKIHNCLLFFAVLVIIVALLAWVYESPWIVFDSAAFQDIGVPSDALDITNLESILDNWQHASVLFFISFAIIALAGLCLRYCCNRIFCCFEWYQCRALLLLTYLCCVFMGIYLLVPTFYEFKKSIKLNPDNQNTFTGSTSVEHDVNSILGYSFVGVFLSYFSNILLYWMHAIPVGVYFSTLIFLYYLFEDDEIGASEKCQCFRKLFKYNIPMDLKATMIARLIVIVFLLQVMASCIESLPVIIMYQSFGSNVMWISAWLIWWIFPLFLLMHLWWICNQYIMKLRKEITIHYKVCQFHVIINGTLEAVLFIIVAVVSIMAESNKTDVAIWFLNLTCCTALIVSALLWIFVLHHMFMNAKDENGIKQKDKIALPNGMDLHGPLVVQDEEKKDVEQNNDVLSSASLQMTQDECGYMCCVFYWWLFEKREIKLPKRYGERVYLRRLFLILGTTAYGYVSIHSLWNLIHLTVKQEVINFFNDMSYNVSWPDDDEGGTLFDSTFSVYNKARIISAVCGVIAFGMFAIASLTDCFVMERRGLKLSKTFGWISMLALAASMFGPSLPNYLSSTPIHDICPYCAPQFTNAIYLLFGDIVGLFCSGLFTIQMLPILVGAVTPAVARSSYMVLHYHNDFKLDADERDTLRYIFICGSFLGPFVTFAPLLVYQQFMGDVVISVLLMIFWILPILIAMRIKTENATRIYVQYMVTYYMTLFAMFIYHWSRYGLPSWLVAMIKTPHWIIETSLEIIAEWCLTNVLLSDFLYTIIMGFRTKHLEDEEIIKRNAIVGK